MVLREIPATTDTPDCNNASCRTPRLLSETGQGFMSRLSNVHLSATARAGCPGGGPTAYRRSTGEGGQDRRGHARCVEAKLREDGGGLAVGDVRGGYAE